MVLFLAKKILIQGFLNSETNTSIFVEKNANFSQQIWQEWP